jgi:hypothetical protein
MIDFNLKYTEEELALIDFVPPTEEEVNLMVLDLEIEMSSMAQYQGASGCSCRSDGGLSCNPSV